MKTVTTRPVATEESLPQAPLSITVKGLLRDRFEVLATVRGRDLARVLATCEHAVRWLEGEPGGNGDAPDGDEEPPRRNGHHGNGGHPRRPTGANGTTGAPPQVADEVDYYCDRHQAKLRRYEKGSAVWFSHRLPDGTWCRGVE